jgi:hypothetical protein
MRLGYVQRIGRQFVAQKPFNSGENGFVALKNVYNWAFKIKQGEERRKNQFGNASNSI